jgi:hypothetical protein
VQQLFLVQVEQLLFAALEQFVTNVPVSSLRGTDGNDCTADGVRPERA